MQLHYEITFPVDPLRIETLLLLLLPVVLFLLVRQLNLVAIFWIRSDMCACVRVSVVGHDKVQHPLH